MINCNLKNINSMNTFEQHILTTSLQTKPLPVAPARSGFELGAKHSWNNWYVRRRLFQIGPKLKLYIVCAIVDQNGTCNVREHISWERSIAILSW